MGTTLHAALSKKKLCFFNKILCMHCTTNMMWMCTFYFVLTLTCMYLVPKAMFNLDVLYWSSLIGMMLCALPINSCAIITNYHACVAMPTWYTCTYFVFTSINFICSCFIHMQQRASPRIAGAGHPCCDRNLFGLFPAKWTKWTGKYYIHGFWWTRLQINIHTKYASSRNNIFVSVLCMCQN